MSKSYILFVMPSLNMGGAERVIINIINHLNKDKFKIGLLLFNANGSLIDELNKDIDIKILNISSVAKGIPALLTKIYSLKPDIVFSGIGNLNLYLSLFIPIMRLLLPKTIWVARQASILTLNNAQEKAPKLYNFLYKRAYKNYDLVICQSKYMQQDLIENYNFPKNKSTVIHNPIDIKRVQILSQKEVDYPFDKEKIKLITVGGLRYEKRQDLLLKAFAKLDSRYVLTIIGDGVKKEELKALASSLNISNRVAFLGYKKNVYSYIKASDIFILTSEYEGFPNVLLEANACGVGVISFDSKGGVSEIIEDGVNGFLVPYKDINALAQKIKELKYGYFNPNKIEELTTKRYNTDSIIKIYENFLRKRL